MQDALQVINDPQLRARDWLVQMEQKALAEPVTHPGPPFRLSKRPWRMRGPAPELGDTLRRSLRSLNQSDLQPVVPRRQP